MHYNSKRNDNPYCSQSICFLKIFSGNCFAFFDSYPSFVSYQKLHRLWRLQTLLLNPYSEIGTSSIWKFFWSYWLSSIMPGRLTAIAIIGYTSLRLMSAQFDCGVSLLSTLHSSWDFTSCFAVTFSLPVATVTVFRALYRQNFLIWEFRSSFFTL